MALKIIHTADWHLGQTFFDYERDEEHDAFLTWLLELIAEEDIDILLITGDVFDVSNPSSASQRRFYSFLRALHHNNPSLQTIIIAGNHDSAARLEAPVPLLEEMNTHIIGLIPRDENRNIDFSSLMIPLYNHDGEREALCIAIPYLRPGDYPPVGDKDEEDNYTNGVKRMYAAALEYALSVRISDTEPLIALGHLYANGSELSDDDRAERIMRGGLDSVNVDAFDDRIIYTALGHIHKAQRIGGREYVRYAGSPLPMSFTEKNYHHQVISFTVENGTISECIAKEIPIYCPLLCIPKEALSPEGVITELAALPLRKKEDNPNAYPYINVRVKFDGPNPLFRSQVDEVLKDKAVRLATISQVSASREVTDENVLSIEYEKFQKLQPSEMLRIIYEKEYDSEMPESLMKLFNDVMLGIEL